MVQKHCKDGSKCASCASSGVDVFDCYAAVDGSDDNKDECSVDKNICSYFEAVANRWFFKRFSASTGSFV